MNQHVHRAAAFAGLAVIAWVGAGYLLTNPLALAVTLLIAALYLAGVLELRRFGQATDALGMAVDELSAPLASLPPWLERVPAGVRHAVRRRVEGEPVALPGPALAPTLAGLLVLLGMLGTFLGMILTLRGTGAALETATDLVAVRNSLIAPVKGLGLAFGTSVAGVAGSAALGLLAALGRRERAAVVQRLDACIAGPLRPFSITHQREESLALMRRQAELMPALVDRLQAMMATLERQAGDSNARLLASQERFQDRTATAYAELAQSVDRTLRASLADSARLAGETIRPVAEATLAGIARETSALHATLAGATRDQLTLLDGIARAAGEQRGAIDALVASSAEVLERAGARFGEQVHDQADRLSAVAAQLTASAVEVASLGEAFGAAVQVFGESGDRLGAHLERIDAALAAQTARGDEQLAYYVAQAREVIDLSILSQQQIIEELQRLAGRHVAEALA